MPCSVVLFDLDGTLADTAPDLARALNILLAEEGRATLPFAEIRPQVSCGTDALLQLGFGCNYGHELPGKQLKQRYLELYLNGIAEETRLFPGMPALIDQLEEQGIQWGVVTNKPAFLTTPLMAALGLSQRAACTVSGDSTPYRKPHPGPLLHACTHLHTPPGNCLYIGDAQRDIDAGRRAGMRTLTALFGYITAEESPHDWRSDGHVHSAHEIAPWMGLKPA